MTDLSHRVAKEARTSPLPTGDGSLAEMQQAIAAAGERLRRTIDAHPLLEPPPGAGRLTTITVTPLAADAEAAELERLSGWRPAGVFGYSSFDPWQQLNPERSVAIENLIAVGIEHARIGHREHDGPLAYDDTDSAAISGRLSFHPAVVNLLDRHSLSACVAGSRAGVLEAIGLAEYIASDAPASAGEAKQRASAQRAGRLSAEGFFGTIYQEMTAGSVLLTGNMRSDSPDAQFVIDGLGWPGIIQRSTAEFLSILQRAGIPGPAVELFTPERETSSGVYNLVAITKQ